MPRNTQHKYVLAYLVAYLSAQHIYSMYSDFGGYNMDVRTYTMLLMIKLWGLTFAYKDGGEKIENLTKDQIERRVVQLPGVI